MRIPLDFPELAIACAFGLRMMLTFLLEPSVDAENNVQILIDFFMFKLFTARRPGCTQLPGGNIGGKCTNITH